jgi:A/G-specific adenine glycosylase
MEGWFSSGLRSWYAHQKRDLPWRNERDPYRIWVSEVILQQTQVAQGTAYYHRFLQNFPTVNHLAEATEDQVLKLWQGLGYYSRARNMHASAKQVVNQYSGCFPSSFNEIKTLKGVGDYTASAIASFAFDLPHAVVDGNVYRVLGRLFGIDTPIDTPAGKKKFSALAQELLHKKDPATHNQAIMEFGSQHCKPVNPDCNACIFRHKCHAFQNNSVSALPVKNKKPSVRTRFFNYIVLADKNNLVQMRRRSEKDIWQGLYEFPLIESKNKLGKSQLLKSTEFVELCNHSPELLFVSKEYKHVLTHQHLYARFFVVRGKGHAQKNAVKKYSLGEMKQQAFPRLIEKFLADCDLEEIL